MYDFLGTFLHAPWMLVGLFILLIPPIIHLLNRRRHDTVDWGAMQFLQVSDIVRRRLMIDEILLMLVRMGLLGVLVFALASPFFEITWPQSIGGRTPRDVVLLIDGSGSMAAVDELGRPSPATKAQEWAMNYLEQLGSSDGVAVLLVRDQITPVIGTLSRERDRIKDRLRSLPEPAGTASWPEAMQQAFALLEKSPKRLREVIILSDNQKFGLTDAETIFRWELLAEELGLKQSAPPNRPHPRLWAVNLATDREGGPPGYGLSPIVSNRPIVPVDREVTFRSELVLIGQKQYAPPHRLRLEVDGRTIRDLPAPRSAEGTGVPRDGKIAFSFTHRFTQPGSHLVSVILEPDLPPEERPAGYTLRDRVPGDNRQNFSVEVVPAIQVLLVDGGASAGVGKNLASDFVRDALSPARDNQPAVQTKVVPLESFTQAVLQQDPRPQVLILHNIAQLATAQVEAVSQFLAGGGGVLVTLGDRPDMTWYNEQLYRDGTGWLPARLVQILGEEGQSLTAVKPDITTFTHPMLDLFRTMKEGGLTEARFPRYWQLATPGQNAPGTPVGILQGPRTKVPFFVERSFQAGRVLVCAVGLDNSWGTNLVDLPAFVPLVHEVVYYLAGARATEFNLRAGQPIRLRVPAEASVEQYRLTPPGGVMQPLATQAGEPGTYQVQLARSEQGNLLIFSETRDPGVYQLETPRNQSIYYVVPGNPRESDLTPCTDKETFRLSSLLGLRFEADPDAILGEPDDSVRQQDFSWLLFVIFIGLLCVEVWMTRRLVQNR